MNSHYSSPLYVLPRFHPLGLGDENVAGSRHGSLEADFSAWSSALIARINKDNNSGEEDKTSDLGESESAEEEESEFSESEGENGQAEGNLKQKCVVERRKLSLYYIFNRL